MFQPDFVSNPKTIFCKAAEQSVAEVSGALRTYYSDIGERSGRIYQSGAVELNSKNFLVDVGDRRYIVKQWPVGGMPERNTRNTQAGLANWLAQQGIPVPGICRSMVSGDFVVEHEACCWCVIEYVDGDYFSGAGQELLDVGLGLCRLFRTLRLAPDYLQISQLVSPPARKTMKMTADLERHRTQWPDVFGEPHASLLNESWCNITKEHAKVLDLEPVLMQSIGLCHIDLHPHNVLMSNGKMTAFLDFPSLVQAPLESIIAFNLFKLARQAIVARAGRYLDADVRDQMGQIIAELRASGLVGEHSPEQFSQLAKVEIMRRLLLILYLNFEKKNRDWNHVLPVQIEALKEADMVFV